ncbi:ArnT family glycosyltransferase [Mucisphaera calidilacus]|uniref:Undecaprenyl phosphate-alpha-4-amino-4-deoxy-L-arabinose arabinosyl transferase n=1 Tax=Mucisphaera calidilacus TaxID=2527982 RepID=A0A518BWA7_9BACT|nr:glycosyltransferase family 39 protein [Mucisphaera calidilacus]QDU71269.1 Undecaprenyl phosphate-alpha-4-amino-4-deoxy-L-arabinose arabinosyl transferase [Mucisphaera calidilacus]
MLVGIGVSSSLWDRDEPRFARAAVEMRESGDLMVPRFNEGVRPDKPAGVYWAMQVGLELFGEHEIAVRLPSIVGLLWTGWLVYMAGRCLSGRSRAGVIAMVVLLTSLMPIVMGTLSTADGLLLGCMTQAYAVLLHRVCRGSVWWQIPVLVFALTLGQLVKGPIGLVIPMANMLLAGWMVGRHQRDDWHLGFGWWISVWVAALLSVVLFLAWGIPANQLSGGVLWSEGIGTHVVDRIQTAQEGHGGSNVLEYIALLPVYVPVVLIGFMPWTSLLPSAVNALRRREFLSGRERSLIWAWITPAFVIMTLVATKLPHYVLPMFPGLAVLVGVFVDRMTLQPVRADTRFGRLGRLFYLVMAGMGGVGLVVGPQVLGDDELAWRCALPALLVLIGTPWVLSHVANRRLLELVWFLGPLTPVVVLALVLSVLPWVESRLKVSPVIAEAIRYRLPDDARVYTLGYREPSLIFYLSRSLGTPVQRMGRTREALDAWVQQERSTPEALVITNSEAERLGITHEDLGATLLERYPVWNYASGTEGRTLVVETWLVGATRDQPTTE